MKEPARVAKEEPVEEEPVAEPVAEEPRPRGRKPPREEQPGRKKARRGSRGGRRRKKKPAVVAETSDDGGPTEAPVLIHVPTHRLARPRPTVRRRMTPSRKSTDAAWKPRRPPAQEACGRGWKPALLSLKSRSKAAGRLIRRAGKPAFSMAGYAITSSVASNT